MRVIELRQHNPNLSIVEAFRIASAELQPDLKIDPDKVIFELEGYMPVFYVKAGGK